MASLNDNPDPARPFLCVVSLAPSSLSPPRSAILTASLAQKGVRKSLYPPSTSKLSLAKSKVERSCDWRDTDPLPDEGGPHRKQRRCNTH